MKKKKDQKYGIFFTILTIWNIFWIGVLIFNMGYNFGEKSLSPYDKEFNVALEKSEDSTIVVETYEKCKDKHEKGYLDCINDVFSKNFKHIGEVDMEPLNESWMGDCESATLFYMNLLDKKNIRNRQIHIDWHIFVLVDFGEGNYCIVDQKTIWCH